MKRAAQLFLSIACLSALNLASFAGDLTLSRAESHVCDLTFLDQSLEPNQEIIRNTLFEILTKDFDLLYSPRMVQSIVGHTFRQFSNVGVSDLGLYLKLKDGVLAYNGGSLVGIGNKTLNEFWRVLRQAKETPAFYQSHFESIAPLVWKDFFGHLVRMNPIQMASTYPIPQNRYDSFLKIVRQIEESPKLKALVFQEIQDFAYHLDDTGPRIQNGWKLLESERASLLSARARAPKIEAPLTALASPISSNPMVKARTENFDFTALNLVLGSAGKNFAEATVELNSFYAVERETFQNDFGWQSFFKKAQGYLKSNGAQSSDKISMIRAAAVASNLVIQHLSTLSSTQTLIALGKKTLEAKLASESTKPLDATVAHEMERQAQASQLQRLLILQSTVQTSLVHALKAQATLESLNGFYHHAQLDKEQRRELQSLLQEVINDLGLDESFKKYLKPGIFGRL